MIFYRVIANCFNIGKLPFAPGTFASFFTLICWLFIPLNLYIQTSLIIFLFLIGLFSSSKTSKYLNEEDPSEIVIDEVVGMGISLFMLPYDLIVYLIAFLLFRIFDIFKPSIIFHIQIIPGGWGIMLDDVLAGLFTLFIVKGWFIVI